MLGFAYLAYSANEQNNKNEIFLYIGLVILIQPFAKIALCRTIWNVVDLIVGIGLLTTLAIHKTSRNSK